MKSLIFITLFLCVHNFASAQIKPLKCYISESVYFATSDLKHKKSFTPFKEIKGGNRKYIFEFYNKSIVLKTSGTSTIFIFEKGTAKNQGELSFKVHNKVGKPYLIVLEHDTVDGRESNDLDIFEIDKNNGFKSVTKYVCNAL